MKTDTIFYQLFKELPQIFFELIGNPETNISAYEFTAPEIKQRAFRLDGVFSTREEFPHEPLYFVETQFYKDNQFYDRLFTGIFLYFYQYQPCNSNWYAIVIYDRRSNETPIPPCYRALIEPHLRCVYLDATEETAFDSLSMGMLKLVVETQKNTSALAQQLIHKAREELTDGIIQSRVIEFIETIVVYKFPQLSREEIETMLGLSELKNTRVYQEAHEEGLQEGIERGLIQGELKAKLEIIPRLLQRDFSIQEIAELLALDVDTVRDVAEER
ncbi:MAG: Rpn family recombination-promoting nuclease/putative transposase [Coleofasciculaceae cyanobacterium]